MVARFFRIRAAVTELLFNTSSANRPSVACPTVPISNYYFSQKSPFAIEFLCGYCGTAAEYIKEKNSKKTKGFSIQSYVK